MARKPRPKKHRLQPELDGIFEHVKRARLEALALVLGLEGEIRSLNGTDYILLERLRSASAALDHAQNMLRAPLTKPGGGGQGG